MGKDRAERDIRLCEEFYMPVRRIVCRITDTASCQVILGSMIPDRMISGQVR
jgi:hypothetical protein